MAPLIKDRLRLLCMLMVMMAAVMPGAQVAAQDGREAAVTAAVTEVSRIERSGDLLLLHDRLQPDVRLIVSRAALVNWYTSPQAVIPNSDPDVLSIGFGSWTWPVTGRTYSDVATVRVRQAGVRDGAAIEQIEVQHYWFDGARWRWFFGADASFVETLEQQAPQEASPSGTLGDVAYARVDLVWSEIFDTAGLEYRSLDDVNTITSLPMQTGCGRMTEEDYADVFYCRLDQEIYYLPEFQELTERQFGDYAWPHIMSHEWGHHIQFLLGINASENPEIDGGLYDIELELQADCLAGVFAQEAVARGWLTETELSDAYQVSLFGADSPNTSFDDPLAHGTGEQRQQAFTTGLEDGLFGCNLDLADAAA